MRKQKKTAKSQTRHELKVWATVKDDQVTGVFFTRDEARAAKTGTPTKFVKG